MGGGLLPSESDTDTDEGVFREYSLAPASAPAKVKVASTAMTAFFILNLLFALGGADVGASHDKHTNNVAPLWLKSAAEARRTHYRKA
jgi:hypothetical protein